MYYLLKTEPSVYSYTDLEREKSTVWDGVTNPQAVKHLRGMKQGDLLVIYHTGEEKRVVGTASVHSVNASNPKIPVVRIEAGRPLGQAHSLADLKSNRLFKESPLARQGRLSVVPLTEEQFCFLVG